MKLSHIYIYPIKSLGGIELDQSTIEIRGLQYDRRWMLVHPDGQFITQRKYPRLALLQTSIQEHDLIITAPSGSLLTIPLVYSGEKRSINTEVWGSSCQGWMYDQSVDKWFSDFLGTPCHLIYMSDEHDRITDQDYAPPGQVVSYADGFPFLIIGQASLDHLNEKLEQHIPMNRFRPNLVFTGGTPHIEDTWTNFQIGTAFFRGVKPCSRCNMTTIDQDVGKISGTEPLETLSSYRRINRKILFGQNLIWMKSGNTISVGNTIQINP